VKAVIKPKKSRMTIDTAHPVMDLIMPFINSFDKYFMDGSHEYLLQDEYRPDTLIIDDSDIFVIPASFKLYLIDFLESNTK